MPDTNTNTNAANTEENNTGTPMTFAAPENGSSTFSGEDMARIPASQDEPTALPVFPDIEFPNIPSTPVIPGGGTPVYPGGSGGTNTWPSFPIFPFPTPTPPSVTYNGQVRFLNASTNGMNLDVLIDGKNVFSGSTFATVSIYITISDGFHIITVRRTNGPILYQQTLAFVSGEKVTMVILDNASGVTLTKVSDMGCTNVPSGYGCLRVANMSYSGSSYDVRLFNNQVVFAGVGYKEVTSFKQASSGTYTFFVTSSQVNITTFNELPMLIFATIIGSTCSSCAVNNPLLTYNINVQPGKAYTSYIIGNPWSNMYQVFTLED